MCHFLVWENNRCNGCASQISNARDAFLPKCREINLTSRPRMTNITTTIQKIEIMTGPRLTKIIPMIGDAMALIQTVKLAFQGG
ncbi:hypothetical protein CGRA01v4_09815 [Colletotrichum graminicola]|nr:hypothetical protein CGRA01v4_09815 [Colletotrichum graminicola]